MPELTDDQLDGLFRKSAEEFDPPYDPAAWQDMKTRLDTNDHTMPAGALTWKNLLRWGLPVLLLLLLTGGGWYAYNKAQPVTGKPVLPLATNGKAIENPQVDESQRVVKPHLEYSEAVDSQHRSSATVDSPELTDAADKKHPANEVEPVAKVNERETYAGESALAKANKLENYAGKPVIAKLGKLDAHAGEPAVRPGVYGNTGVKAATKGVVPAYRLNTEPVRMNRLQPASAISKLVIRKATANRQRPSQRTNRAGSLPARKHENSDRVPDLSVVLTTSSAVPPARSITNRRITDNPDWVDVNTSGTVNDTSPLGPVAMEPDKWLTITELVSRPAHWPQPLMFTDRPILMQPDTAATTRKVVSVPPTSERGLSVRLVVAPELSTVGLKNFSKLGTNVGLLLEYRLDPRWSIQAGVIQSTKVYKALGSEYVVPYGMWAAPFKMPETVDGRCNMLDIPLNVRYDLAVLPRADGRLPNRLFVSGGLTTYIMNKEDYHYTYSSYVHGQKNDASYSTGAYGFSNLNLSVGYEQSLSRRLSWQVEPFMKVPLKGVGYFKIDLLSTGAFFSLRYKL